MAETLTRESALFAALRRAFVEQSSMLRIELAQTRQEIAISVQMIQTMSHSHEMAAQQRRTSEALQLEGFVAATKVLDLRRTEVDALTRVQSGNADLSRAKQRQTDLDLRINGLRNDYVKTADDELKDATTRAVQMSEKLRLAHDLSARTRVMAPVAGVIAVGRCMNTAEQDKQLETKQMKSQRQKIENAQIMRRSENQLAISGFKSPWRAYGSPHSVPGIP